MYRIKRESKIFNILRTIAICKCNDELKKKGGRIHIEMLESLILKIDENPFITIKIMIEKTRDKYKMKVHPLTKAIRLESILTIYKVEKAVKQSRNLESTKRKRFENVTKYESAVKHYHIH